MTATTSSFVPSFRVDQSVVGSSFTFRELSGNNRRTVVLRKRALPYRPVAVPTGQRVAITWAPGSPVGTDQPIGTQEQPLDMEGFWKDKFIGVTDGPALASVNGTRITDVRALVNLFCEFANQGQRIEVTWDDIFRRVGYLEAFTPSWLNRHDVKWTMHWVWISKGESPPPPVLHEEVRTQEYSSRVAQQGENLNDAMDTPPLAILQNVRDMLRQISQRMGSTIDQIQNTATQQVDSVIQSAEAVRSIVSQTASIGLRATEVVSTYSAQTANALIRTTTPIAEIPESYRVSMEHHRREVIGLARQMMREAAVRRAVATERAESDVRAIYVAKDGDDLRGIARLYYGDQSAWRTLADFNGFSESTVEAGTLVLIPTRSAT